MANRSLLQEVRGHLKFIATKGRWPFEVYYKRCVTIFKFIATKGRWPFEVYYKRYSTWPFDANQQKFRWKLKGTKGEQLNSVVL